MSRVNAPNQDHPPFEWRGFGSSPFVSVLALTLALVAPDSARAWCRMTTSMIPSTPGACVHDGVPLAWGHRCTSYRFFSDGTPDMSWSDLRAVAALSFGAWDDVVCPDGAMPGLVAREGTDATGAPELSLCDRAEYNIGGPNVATIVFVPDWSTRPMYDPSAYAVTTVWHNTRTGEIYDVDMEYNEQRGPFTRCGDVPCTDGRVDLQNVMTHEAGHWYGMAHTPDDAAATMYFAAPAGEIDKRTLQPDDIGAFCDAYEFAGLGSSCDDTPRGGLKLTCGATACGPDPQSLQFSPSATGSLGASPPVICHGGAATCGVVGAGRDGPFPWLMIVGTLAVLRRRTRK